MVLRGKRLGTERMKKTAAHIVLCALALLWSVNAWGLDDAFVIEDIQVRGLQTITPGTVFNYLPLTIGDEMDAETAGDVIRTLFQTGFFEDVQLERDGSTLVVIVRERQTVASVTFSGNREFDDDTLGEITRQMGLAEGRIFNEALLDNLVQDIKAQYFSRGRYGAEVTSEVTELERNRVGVHLRIREGEVARIRQINIVGNESFSDRELLGEFNLSTRRRPLLFRRRDQYSREQLQADLEALRSFYQDQGYLNFNIESTQVSISPDKQDIFITVNISEGGQYRIGEYALTGRILLPEDELRALVQLEPGNLYSRRAVAETTRDLSDRFANEGYAFANVNAIPTVDEQARTVDVEFFVDPGRRIYVRRIEIAGNQQTRDIVIRRELRQVEGAWYSAERVRRSRVRLQRLGFFDDISIETPTVPGSPDQVDIEIEVSERPTGTLLVGIGYSDDGGLLLQGSVAQRNLFGTGRELEVSVDLSDVTDVGRIRYVDPYHTIDGVSREFELFRRKVDAREARTAEYITESFGGAVGYRFPLTEFLSLSAGLDYERIEIEATNRTPVDFLTFIDENPRSDVFQLTSSLSHDTRDSTIFPTEGALNRVSVEVAVPGSDLEYWKAMVRTTIFRPGPAETTFKVSGEISYGDGYGDSELLPFFKNFFAGGSSTVRGYRSRSLGPRDSSDDPSPIGGSKRLLTNVEWLIPFPGDDADDKRISLFIDGGQVYGDSESIDVGELRFAGGVALSWFSPLGPLSLSFAQAINDKPGDRTERIQFTLGQMFR
jgi:outer membrane protein insertion porin family